MHNLVFVSHWPGSLSKWESHFLTIFKDSTFSLSSKLCLWALADGEDREQWSHMFSSYKGHVYCLMNIWFLIMDVGQMPIIWILITMMYIEFSLAAWQVDVPESPCWVQNIESCLALRCYKENSTLCSFGELPFNWQICWAGELCLSKE